jgi:hypothetical protein
VRNQGIWLSELSHPLSESKGNSGFVIELSRLSTEIQIFSVKCHQLTDPKLGVCEENEECLITIMEVGRERFREAGVMDLFDLFWG